MGAAGQDAAIEVVAKFPFDLVLLCHIASLTAVARSRLFCIGVIDRGLPLAVTHLELADQLIGMAIASRQEPRQELFDVGAR